ncbi:MAG: helix-turn-helix transcriptional regulator [Prevotellaceae bacterium]|nr:helix-turn-helix transcriptional regulator [Prevotellaceae bacterium]MDY3365156.1 helix-turn-helix transcriptional regulator [Prevotella sp.]
MLSESLINNIRKLMNDRNITQAAMAGYLGISPSQFSKVLSGKVRLKLEDVSKLATSFSMREIDLITYPDVYLSQKETMQNEPEVVLQIKLKKDKRDQVLRLIFGNKDIEVLSK